MTSEHLPELQPFVSRFLDDAMANAIDAARGSRWSDEGIVEFVRLRMDHAYAIARIMVATA